MEPATMAYLGGQVLSGLGGLFGGKKKGPDMNEQMQAQTYWGLHSAREMPLAMKEGWEKAGIHPIYGMSGGSTAFSPSFSIGGSESPSVGEKISGMGQSISRAAEAYAGAQERLQNRMLETQIQGQELENMKKASDLVTTTTGAPPGIGNVPQSFYSSLPTPLGTAGNAPLTRTAITREGVPVRVWNEQDLGDSEVMSALTALGVSGGDLLHGYIGRPIANKLRKYFGNQRKSFNKMKGGK